jgi:hypothetical protein
MLFTLAQNRHLQRVARAAEEWVREAAVEYPEPYGSYERMVDRC